jgi:hypothetical protein
MNIDDTDQPESNFATFEAEATGKQPDEAPTQAAPAKADEQADKPDDTLELGTDETPELKEGEEGEGKGRSRPWSKRVDILTARNAEKDREIADLKARLEGRATSNAPTLEEVTAKEPKPEDFEFGQADPDYLEARQDWKLEVRDAKTREEGKKADEQKLVETVKQEALGKVREGAANIEKQGTEAYDDFEEKLGTALEEHGPLSPMASVAVAVSPAGGHIAYKLASDPEARQKLETLATKSVPSAALLFGQMEGEFLPADHDDSDLDLNDPLDMMRLNGRMKARLAGKGGTTTTQTTKAPKSEDNRARGATGRFEARADTTNFADFEKLANKK